ncbi:MAG: 50S ribosomal protein L11 methyltransferase [Candidatus Omnitrophota bacterium]|nr:50S ribosomal protein L11 methyltransferase [Candidatus Omnitrophota bacterium]MDZ4243471.1 50S ribosomal protein L11 methyltransferase [Candidatus Omnitrophota bacterium]
MASRQVFELNVFPRTKHPIKIELLRAALAPRGFVETTASGSTRFSFYYQSRGAAQAALREIRASGMKCLSGRVKHLAASDWRDKWKKAFVPFKLTDRLDVVPAWRQASYRGRRIPVVIDTVLAFGTGLHETTRFMARLMESRRGTFDSFLDIGTGTGLLAIVASHCGARTVWGVDIDPSSLRVARQNLAANGLRFSRTKAGDFRNIALGRTFDFVAANLVTQDLIAMRREILSAVGQGKYLAVSGVSLGNLTVLRKAFSGLPLRCRAVIKGRKWAAVLYQRR